MSKLTEVERFRRRARLALMDIARISGFVCSSFHGTNCKSQGRTKRAKYGADRWCDACIALDGLEKSK